MQNSCKSQNINSLSGTFQNISDFLSPDEEMLSADKKGIRSHLRKASLTVESAFIIPIFLAAIICMASIMGVYGAVLDKMIGLRDDAQAAASALSFSDDEVWIDLTSKVVYTPLLLPQNLASVNVVCTGSARVWTGRDGSTEGNDEYSGKEYVYVTENGTVYHTSSLCTHINLSIYKVNEAVLSGLRNENGGKYKACEKCAEHSEINGEVYITPHGDRYHLTLSCGGLKRTVKMVEISSVEGLKECERCASEA